MANARKVRIGQALSILVDLGMPRGQLNERSALCLLAILDLTPEKAWANAGSPLVGITPIMDWARQHYKKRYAPNTRETVRRQTMHQFMEAGIVLYNPDQPERPVNSPHAVYQVEPTCLELLRSFRSTAYKRQLSDFLARRQPLAAKYARERQMNLVPLTVPGGQTIHLSPGRHSDLIRSIVEKFAPQYVPGGRLIYAGDTGRKWAHFDVDYLSKLGVHVDSHGKMPDVVIYSSKRDWLILVEAVTSHGPVDPKRHEELRVLFKNSRPGLVFVSAFPDRRTFTKYLKAISWETEVWIAESPSHLVHFNGARFLGPH